MKQCFKQHALVFLLLFISNLFFAQAVIVDPNPVSCGYVVVGEQAQISVNISTLIAGGVEVTSISLDDDTLFSVSHLPVMPNAITPALGMDFMITFTPVSDGYASTVLTVSVAGYTSENVTVFGTGKGADTPDMLSYPATFDFGNVNIGEFESTNLSVSLSTEWLADHVEGTVNSATLIGNPDFSSGSTISTNTSLEVVFPYLLDETDGISFEIYYSPSVAETENAMIELSCDDGKLYHIMLQGTGVSLAPVISIDPNSINITVNEGETTTSFFDVINTGIEDLHFGINNEELPAWIVLDQLAGTAAQNTSVRINIDVDTYGIAPGNYSYLLDIDSDDPANPTMHLMITVSITALPLYVDFSAAPRTGHPPFNVTFSDNSHTNAGSSWSNISSWRWDFDNDGVFDSFVQNPVHSYALPGIYSVRLVATTNTGVINSKLKTDYITASNVSPQIVMPLNEINNMVEDTQWGPTDVTYIFNDPDGDQVFISCEASEHLNATVEFGYLKIIPASNWNGTETISLRAVDRFGKGPVQEIDVTVAPVNDAPILSVPSEMYFIRNSHFTVDFGAYIDDPDNDDSDLSIQILPDLAGSPIVFAYTPLPMPSVVGQLGVIFSSPSQVGVNAGFSIHVNDNVGRLIATAHFNMFVLEQFNPTIHLAATYQYAGQTVGFLDATLGNPDYWLWEFGDGNTSTVKNPQHQYMQAGTYNIRLTLGNTEADESAMSYIPGMIHLVGTAVTDTSIPNIWTLQGSPYNLFDGVQIEETTTITVQEGVEVNLFGDEPVLVMGSLNAVGAVFQPQTSGGVWGGLRFRGGSRNPSNLDNCDLIDAILPIDIDGANLNISHVYISVSDTTQFVTGTGVSIKNSSCQISDTEILNYYGGIVVESGDGGRNTPTLTNIRVRNSTSTLRSETNPSTGVTIRSGAVIHGLTTDNCDTGIDIGSVEGSSTATPTLTNIRVRNSSNTLRAVESGTGITLNGNVAPSLNDVQIQDVATGIRIDNVASSVRNTPTLTNIRVRNSTSTLRSATNGMVITNTPQVIIQDAEFDDFTTGILISASYRASDTPTLTNIRVRNSTSTLRTQTTGIKVEGSVIARMDDIEIEGYNTGMDYELAGASINQSTPTLTNIRVRNSTSTLRNETLGAVFTGLEKLEINDMEIMNYQTGLKILPADLRAESTPTLTNIRVRNSTSTLRTETIGIHLGANVYGSLTGCVVDSMEVGILIAEGNRTVLENNRIIDCMSGIRASGTDPLPIKKQTFLLQYPFTNYRALELFGSGPWSVHQNTIYQYPIGVKANNAVINFHSNILWKDFGSYPIPVQGTSNNITNSYNDIYNGVTVFPGVGNINAYPCFTNPAVQDFRITRDSPCIDAGNPMMLPESDGSIIDIGAFSYFHRASANASPRFVVAGSLVEFSNTSLGHDYPDTEIVWDIGNDNTVESTSRSFNHMFSTPGLYDVKLKLTSGLLTDEIIYPRFIVVSANLLQPPSNPVLTKQGDDIVFSWSPVIQAGGGSEVPFYIVFKADTPDGFYKYRGFSTSSSLPFIDYGAASAQKAFYIVIGFDGTRGELMEYIQRLNADEGIRSRK